MTRRPPRDPVAMRSVLGGLFKKLGLSKAMARHRVVEAWPRIVGKGAARHCRADKLTGSTLHVSVDSSVFMNDLSAMKPIILDKLNSLLDPGAPPITDIRFRQCSWIREAGRAAPPEEIPEPSDSDRSLVSETVNGVGDEGLKTLVERLMEKDRRLKLRRRS